MHGIEVKTVSCYKLAMMIQGTVMGMSECFDLCTLLELHIS